MKGFVIGIQKEGKTSYLKVERERVNVSTFGVLSAKEMGTNQAAVIKLLEQAPNAFKNATKAEYDAFQQTLKGDKTEGESAETKSKSKPKSKEE